MISEARRAKLRAQAEAHVTWEKTHLAGASFNPRQQGSDYNLHYADVEAAAGQLGKALVPDLVKVGPKGYVHGWIKVGAVDGIKDVTYSKKTGRIRHRGTKTIIGRIDRDESGKWYHEHENGHRQSGHGSAQAAARALVEHHNSSVQGQHNLGTAPAVHAPSAESLSPGPSAAGKAAAKRYVEGANYDLNPKLRNGDELTGEQQKISHDLDTAIDGSVTDRPMTLFRGVRQEIDWEASNAAGKQINTPHLPDEVGATFSDLGYSSTSTRQESAAHFADVMLEIHAPAGSHALDMRHAGHTITENEQEFLLPRGSRFKVTGSGEHDGTKVIKVDLLPSSEPEKSAPKKVAPFAVFPEGKISSTDDRSRYVTLGADRADERAAMFWSTRFQHVKAIKKAARGEEFSMNVSPSRDYSVDGYPEIYGEKEYAQDVKHAAEWMTKSVNEAPATSAPLYRGMAISDPEVEKALTTVGSEFPSDLASWSRKPAMAKMFADMHHDNLSYAGPSTKIVMELEPGAHALDIEPHVHGPLKDQAEHVATGRYQVVGKDVKDGVVHVKVREVSRDPLGTQDQRSHGSVSTAGGEGPGGEGPGGGGVKKPGPVPSAREKAGADWAKKNHVKFYHGARHSEQLKVGDLIEPGHESQMGMSSNDQVYFKADPQTAEQYARGTPKAGTKPGMTPYVYEVRPVGDFHNDPGSPGYRSPSALRIVARVPVPKTKLGFGPGQGYTLPAGNHADDRVEGKWGGSKHPLFAGKDPEYEADAQHFEDMWYGGDDY